MTVNVARRGARYAERAGVGRRQATNGLTTILVSLALSMHGATATALPLQAVAVGQTKVVGDFL